MLELNSIELSDYHNKNIIVSNKPYGHCHIKKFFPEDKISQISKDFFIPEYTPESPDKLFQKTKFSFIPKSNYGAKNPKLKDQICYGVNLKDDNEISQIKLEWLINSYIQFPHKEDFFYPNFNKISGSNQLQNQIIKGLSEKEIKNTWISDLNNFKKIRKKYLIYSNK